SRYKNINHSPILKLNIHIFKYFFLNITFFAGITVFAQVPDVNDTTARPMDTLVRIDSLLIDSVRQDTLGTSPDTTQTVADSARNNSLQSPINSTAADST